MTKVESVGIDDRDKATHTVQCGVSALKSDVSASGSAVSHKDASLLLSSLKSGISRKTTKSEKFSKLQHCKSFCFDVGHSSKVPRTDDDLPPVLNSPQNNLDGEVKSTGEFSAGGNRDDAKENENKRESSNSYDREGQSVFAYFCSELTRGYLLEHNEATYSEKREKIYTFMKIPRELEKFMLFAFFYCLDAFLYVFTFLPLRFTMGFIKLGFKLFLSVCISQRRIVEAAQVCDLLKGIILVTCLVLMQYVDISMMYHIIRGQAIIKLYLFFNMLEVADRLFASFGQDVLDSLFWTATEPRRKKREHVRVLAHFALAVFYVFSHSMLMLCQATTLNVAFNSHNKALLTIMISNNFLELKSHVFKKLGKNNVFQISCYDVRERFHFVVLLGIVCMRNLTEFSWSMAHMWVLFPDVMMILGSEFLVDWVKHAFITKFNEIPDEVYNEYRRTLAVDMMTVRMTKSHSDQLDLLSRRMGFTPLPLAVILVRVVGQSIHIDTYKTAAIAALFYLCLVSFKVLNSVVLLGKACSIVDAKHKPSSPSTTEDDTKPPSGQKTKPEEERRRSDPCVDSKYSSTNSSVQEILVDKRMKRSQSVSSKMDMAHRGAHSENHLVIPENELSRTSTAVTDQHDSLPDTPLEPKLLFENSTVSLQSAGLGSEYDEDKIQQAFSRNNGENSVKVEVLSSENLSGRDSELRRRKVQQEHGDVER